MDEDMNEDEIRVGRGSLAYVIRVAKLCRRY
jgi:hypothetical protein